MYTKKINERNDLCNSTYMKSYNIPKPCCKCIVRVTKPITPLHRRRYQQQMETTFSTVHMVFVNRTCPKPQLECPPTEYGEGVCTAGGAIIDNCQVPCCTPWCTYCC
ncbi:uncharacterized protein LOC129780518 [Toxorhynchites rutilus septentrionalis]|uniref:uncharacterized protein LOC129774386 n=1 Tax=Toxorhynchites rutilus septentrionalis TaxID=329112 RepID=UPI00247A7212|nr:uncharacterized protein LOC129774386 [Toxorhynchites rutilus septentrionalis]XP_055644827.1 uncharacterized protein LOC129780518 [Toxorhynchites rutilus septentrionalis]